MADSDIGWTDKVWNVTRGCRRISPGCGGAKGEGGCYAEKTAFRFAGPGQPYEGLVKLTANGPRWTGEGRFVAEKLAEPLRWRKPCRIFVDSMSDLFFDAFTFEQIAAVFGVMAACPQHTFQVLTKRPHRMRAWFEWATQHGDGQDLMRFGPSALLTCAWEACSGDVWGDIEPPGKLEALPSSDVFGTTWPLPNVHLGTSVENQETLDERWPHLFATPAAVRFFSVEPLLGPLDFTHVFADAACRTGRLWIITGCESGGGARPALQTWFESIADQCRVAHVPMFLKQMMCGGRLCTDVASFPPHLRIQEFPQ
jgi:protein gp37